MKLPICPHCDKLMAGTLVRVHFNDGTGEAVTQVVDWICPEKAERLDPIWMEVEGRRLTKA